MSGPMAEAETIPERATYQVYEVQLPKQFPRAVCATLDDAVAAAKEAEYHRWYVIEKTVGEHVVSRAKVAES